MEDVLKPLNCQDYAKPDRFRSETKRQYQEYDQEKNMKEMSNKADVMMTRRMLEVYNNDSLNKAAGQSIITNTNLLRDKISKYINQKGNQMGNDNYEWTPCRFSKSGWKYQPEGTQNRYLNHKNKRNLQGYKKGQNSFDDKDPDQKLVSPLLIDSELEKYIEKEPTKGVFSPFTTSYNDQFQNRSNLSKTMNTSQAKEFKKNMVLQDTATEDPPLPNIQAARISYLRQVREDQRKKSLSPELSTINEIPQINISNRNNTKTNLNTINKIKKPLFQSTLNGLQANADEDDVNCQYWGGIKVKSTNNGSFGIEKDKQGEWESIFYKGGLFKYIQ